MVGFNWIDEETKSLIDIWSDRHFQRQLAVNTRNMRVFNEIASRLNDSGFVRTGLQCREKIKKLKFEWRKIRDHNAKGGNRKTSKFYDDIEAVIGDSSPSVPIGIIESSTTPITEEVSHFDQEESQMIDTDMADLLSATSSNPPNNEAPESEVESSSPHAIDRGTAIKNQPSRKRGRVSYMTMFLDTQKRMRSDLLAWEERRWKLDAELEKERRKAEAEVEKERQLREHQHEERLFAMLLKAIKEMSSHNGSDSSLITFP